MRNLVVFAALLFACGSPHPALTDAQPGYPTAVDASPTGGDGSPAGGDAGAPSDAGAGGDAAPPVIDAPTCGDGVIEAGEQCDDGNAAPGDGCGATCRIEPGWVCSAPVRRACA